jgi:sugar diacid utilization regulator
VTGRGPLRGRERRAQGRRRGGLGRPAGPASAAPALQARLGPGQLLRIGVGPAAAATVPALRGSLVGARYALASADPYADAARLDTLASLLAGIPAAVTSAFHQRLLGRLLAHDRENSVSLLDTLAAFLERDGSWSRTAKTLHVHVNTVHYRARRIEELTGRSLVRLADQADLRAALLCAPATPPG